MPTAKTNMLHGDFDGTEKASGDAEAKHLGTSAECGSSAGFIPCRDEPEHNPRSTAKHLGAATECGSSAGFMPC